MRAGAMAMAAVLALGGGLAQEKQAEVRLVKYSGLVDVVKQHRGKVILIDCWTFE